MSEEFVWPREVLYHASVFYSVMTLITAQAAEGEKAMA